jgi:hypothetical protein
MAVARKRYVKDSQLEIAGVGKRRVSNLAGGLCIQLIMHENFLHEYFFF